MTDDSHARRCKCAYPDDPDCPVHGDFVIPEEAVEAGTQAYERGLGPGVHRMEEVVAAILAAALPHLRAHQAADSQVAPSCSKTGSNDERSITVHLSGPGAEFVSGTAFVSGASAVPTEAETATRVGYELGRKEALAEVEAAIKDHPGPDPSPASPAWWAGYVEAQGDMAKIVREIGGTS